MDNIKQLPAYILCEKVAETTWKACMETRNKTPDDAGCLFLKDFARITCVGELKGGITNSHSTVGSRS